jgi:UDP-glucose 4-epimerase
MQTASRSAAVEPLPQLLRKRILVTGGASGIGQATAAFFASARATMVVTDRDADLMTDWLRRGTVATPQKNLRRSADCRNVLALRWPDMILARQPTLSASRACSRPPSPSARSVRSKKDF